MNFPFAMAAALLLRNPFWPIGYEGVREEISVEARVTARAEPERKDESQTARAQQESMARAIETEASRDWAAAGKSLRIGGRILARRPDGTVKSAIFINGRDYADGDLLSVDFNGRRFTWRVSGLADGGTLRLKRIRARPAAPPHLKGQ